MNEGSEKKRPYRWALLLFVILKHAGAWSPLLDRRSFSAIAAGGVTVSLPVPFPANVAWAVTLSASGVDSSDLLARFENDILKQPPVSMGSESNGIDNMYFPSFMQGTWQVTQTLVGFSTPLGLVFAGGPNGLESIATRTMQDTRERLDIPVQLQLRFVPTKWGVAEDRLFNTRQRVDAFAGRSVVASVGYADVGSSNRASILAMGGTEDDPLQTTIVRFKGPAAQKTFITGHSTSTTVASNADDNNSLVWTGYEMQRSIFALTNTNTAPPITTDQELLWNLKTSQDDLDHVQGRFRIASYLNPTTDKLYFEARNRAVSLLDYTLDMKRL